MFQSDSLKEVTSGNFLTAHQYHHFVGLWVTVEYAPWRALLENRKKNCKFKQNLSATWSLCLRWGIISLHVTYTHLSEVSKKRSEQI